MSFIYQAIAVGTFEPALPNSKAPAPKLDNGKELFQSELAREVPSFPSPFPPGPFPYLTELEQSRCCRQRVMENVGPI